MNEEDVVSLILRADIKSAYARDDIESTVVYQHYPPTYSRESDQVKHV